MSLKVDSGINPNTAFRSTYKGYLAHKKHERKINIQEKAMASLEG